MQTNIDIITKFITTQMDGEPVPCSGSAAFNQLSEALQAVKNDARDSTFKALGLAAIVAVLDRVHSNLGAEKTLLKFIGGGGHA